MLWSFSYFVFWPEETSEFAVTSAYDTVVILECALISVRSRSVPAV